MLIVKESNDNEIINCYDLIFTINIIGLSSKEVEDMINESFLINEDISMSGEEFEVFKTNVILIFKDRNYKLLKENKSPESNSLYLFFIKEDEEGNLLRAMIEIRLSDHPLVNKNLDGKSINGFKQAMTYLHRKAKRLSKKTYNQKEVVRTRFIYVNGHNYEDYDTALNYVERRLDNFENLYFKNKEDDDEL